MKCQTNRSKATVLHGTENVNELYPRPSFKGSLRNGVAALIFVFSVMSGVFYASGELLGVVDVGDENSEAAYELSAVNSEKITGAFDLPARRLLPDPDRIDGRKPQDEGEGWFGGELTFTVPVDPEKQNYVTMKLWGSETTDKVSQTLHLFYDDNQLVDLSVRDPFDKCASNPAFPERFYYTTAMLPETITEGKESIKLTLRSSGGFRGYGRSWQARAHIQHEPSRAIYRLYSHSHPFFEPPEEEAQGKPVALGPDREVPERYADRDLQELLIEKADALIRGLLEKSAADLSRDDVRALASIVNREWSEFHHSREALKHFVGGLDFYAEGQARGSPADPEGYGYIRWGGQGYFARALLEVHDVLDRQGILDEEINHDGDPETPDITRRAAYAEFFDDAMHHHMTRRRLYTNQAIAVDTGMYSMNRALRELAPEIALPEDEAKQYLYETFGLSPWTGGELGKQSDIRVVSPKGLAKELGYVALYGAGSPRAAARMGELSGDGKLMRRARQMATARSFFHITFNDPEGYRALGNIQSICWRHTAYPGRVQYGSGSFRSGLPEAAEIGDPASIRRAQLFLESNRIYEALNGNYPASLWINLVDSYREVKDMPPTGYRLPMEEEHPDFAWADEGAGAVAVKHGDTRIFASLYWKGIAGIRDMDKARVHYTTPIIDRVATVAQETEFKPSGESQTVRADRAEHQNVGWLNPPHLATAWGGMEYPVAATPPTPDGREFDKLLDGDPRGGYAYFYRLHYGDYLFGMNTTHTETYELKIPSEVERAEELTTGRVIQPLTGGSGEGTYKYIKVPPRKTAILYLGTE